MEYMEYPMEHPVELYGILNEIYEISYEHHGMSYGILWDEP